MVQLRLFPYSNISIWQTPPAMPKTRTAPNNANPRLKGHGYQAGSWELYLIGITPSLLQSIFKVVIHRTMYNNDILRSPSIIFQCITISNPPNMENRVKWYNYHTQIQLKPMSRRQVGNVPMPCLLLYMAKMFHKTPCYT